MSWSQILAHAARNVGRRPLRNILAGLGVALGTATLVALLALGRGLQLQVLERGAEQPLLTLVQITSTRPPAGGTARPLDDSAVDAIKRTPHVRTALPVVVVLASVRLADRSVGGTVLGMSPAGRAPYALSAGRAPDANETGVAILTPVGVRSLGASSDSAVGRQIELEVRRGETRAERRTTQLRVVGVAADDLPGQLALISLPDAEDALAWIATAESDDARSLRLAQQAAAALLFGGQAVTAELPGSRYTGIWAFADSVDHLRDVVRDVQALGFAALSRAALDQTVDDLFRAVNATLAAVAAIALLVAMLGVVNSLVTTVSERTAEIGVLKTLGASDTVVERLFLAEAMLLGVVGGFVGIVAGSLAALIAAAFGRQIVGGSVRLEPLLDAPLVLAALLAAIGVALVGGWLPARRAARLVPAEALRSE